MSIEAAVARVASLQSAFQPAAPAPAATPAPTSFASALGTAMSGTTAGTTSAATAPAPFSSAPAGSYPNLSGDLDASPELLARLQRLAASRGERWTVTSGLRTDAEQARLWANRFSNPYPVARPGTSLHRTGTAADVTVGGRAIQDVVPAGELRAAGLAPLAGDAVHVELA
jgi:LAS superfamily LD-carboxypeptidase LdcB